MEGSHLDRRFDFENRRSLGQEILLSFSYKLIDLDDA